METERTRKNKERYQRYAAIRDEKGMTDYRVSQEAGVPSSTIFDWKSGTSTPAFENIVKIANCLNVSANVFEA